MKSLLTFDAAKKIAGEQALLAVAKVNAEPTNRCMPAGEDNLVEFAASVVFNHRDRVGSLTAIYYQQKDDMVGLEDLSILAWEIAGYEICEK